MSVNILAKAARAFEILKESKTAAKEINSISGFGTCYLYRDILLSRIRYGASSEDYMALEFYRKSVKERKTFNTWNKVLKSFYKTLYVKKDADIFDHKEVFSEVFKNFIKHEVLFADGVSADIEKIKSFIDKHKTVVVKPYNGANGIGVYKLHSSDQAGIDSLMADLRRGEQFMIEQLIVQHPLMAKLNPASVNTIRIETMIDRQGEVHIINTIVIMGAGDNVVNNTHHGGVMCHVDSETGVIDSYGRNPRGEYHFRNPETKIILPGYQIPNWNGIIDYAKSLAKVVPTARLIGWDIVILEEGYDIIEGNERPGYCTQACDGVGRYQLIKSLE